MPLAKSIWPVTNLSSPLAFAIDPHNKRSQLLRKYQMSTIARSPKYVHKYNLYWPKDWHPAEIEMECIRRKGRWKKKDGTEAGEGLFFHYCALMKILWPEEDQHRWLQLMLKEYLDNILTSVSGPKDSGKTHTASMIALVEYYTFPLETLILVSSTDVRGLELRIWGDMKSLHVRAKGVHEDLPGRCIDSKHAICTDDLDDEAFIRDMRRGIVCVPCLGSNGQFVGLGRFVGLKQKRRRLFADEFALMKSGILDSLANLNSNDFKAMFLFNPVGDGDPADKISEPKSGWSTHIEPQKTTVWETRDIGGRCINLVGTDSPNFDYPQDEPPRFPYLIHQKSIDRVVARYGLNSFQYYSQCKGVRMTGIDAMKVITRDLCVQFQALEQVFWWGDNRTKVYAVDAAYGSIGGDRCVGGWLEYGKDVSGNMVMSINPPRVIPVKPAKLAGRIPEDQIAMAVREECEREKIPPSHVFYDATGRGSLGTSFGRLWSTEVNPVEFGGAPTERPVHSDLPILDVKTGQWRPMIAKERFSKFVTELWWSVRYVIEARQMRNLPEDVMEEGCRRLWRMVRGDRIEVETKEDMKERTGESPDLFDWLATCVEGARRLGFTIKTLETLNIPKANTNWKRDLKERAQKIRSRYELNYSA